MSSNRFRKARPEKKRNSGSGKTPPFDPDIRTIMEEESANLVGNALEAYGKDNGVTASTLYSWRKQANAKAE